MEDARAYQELRVGFTAAVSHELRTPLARLLVILETAALPGTDRDELLSQAREEVEQMAELVNDVTALRVLEGDFHEGDTVDEAALKALILDAVGLNTPKQRKR
jgi:signal transduction histidine kinase